jgi:hypothetical protein
MTLHQGRIFIFLFFDFVYFFHPVGGANIMIIYNIVAVVKTCFMFFYVRHVTESYSHNILYDIMVYAIVFED